MKNSLRILLSILLFLPGWVYAGDKTTDMLIKQIDYLQNRHEVLAQNIANVSTPKYITRDLDKPEMLATKNHKVGIKKVRLAVTNQKHLMPKRAGSSKYSIVSDKTDPMKPNKNNVDLSKQVTKMATNTDESTQALKNYRTAIDLVNTAADGGNGQ